MSIFNNLHFQNILSIGFNNNNNNEAYIAHIPLKTVLCAYKNYRHDEIK